MFAKTLAHNAAPASLRESQGRAAIPVDNLLVASPCLSAGLPGQSDLPKQISKLAYEVVDGELFVMLASPPLDVVIICDNLFA